MYILQDMELHVYPLTKNLLEIVSVANRLQILGSSPKDNKKLEMGMATCWLNFSEYKGPIEILHL